MRGTKSNLKTKETNGPIPKSVLYDVIKRIIVFFSHRIIMVVDQRRKPYQFILPFSTRKKQMILGNRQTQNDEITPAYLSHDSLVRQRCATPGPQARARCTGASRAAVGAGLALIQGDVSDLVGGFEDQR